ncbi:MAG TPA: hypothetical protein VGD80_19910 [Kofleriaceae bacterium]
MSLGALLFAVALAGPSACAVTSPEPTGGASPIDPSPGSTPDDPSERVITAADTAQLSPDHHLTLDVRFGSYAFDMSSSDVDLRYVDVIDPLGRTLPVEHLTANVLDTGTVTSDDLTHGFSVRASGDQVEVAGHVFSTERAKPIKCYVCACDDTRCVCVPIPCGGPDA